MKVQVGFLGLGDRPSDIIPNIHNIRIPAGKIKINDPRDRIQHCN